MRSVWGDGRVETKAIVRAQNEPPNPLPLTSSISASLRFPIEGLGHCNIVGRERGFAQCPHDVIAVRKTHFRLAGCFLIEDDGLRRRLVEDNQPYQRWACERPARGRAACPQAAAERLLARFPEISFGICYTQQRPRAVTMTSSKTVPSSSARPMEALKKRPGKKGTRPASCPNLVAHMPEVRPKWTIQAIGSQ